MRASPVLSQLLISGLIIVGLVSARGEYQCPAPRAPDNGVSYIFHNGQEVRFRCHHGYTLVGYNVAVCEKNTWSRPPPTCRLSTVNLTEVDETCLIVNSRSQWSMVEAPVIPYANRNGYGRIRNPNSPNNVYVKVYYRCQPGYKFVNPQADALYCRQKEWIGEYPVCAPAEDRSDVGRDSNNAASDNSCRINRGGCSHVCVPDHYGRRAYCGCYRGFTLDRDGRTCNDVNECETENGGCEGLCNNLPGSFTCQCQRGFLLGGNRKSCSDWNECLSNAGRGPCQDQCQNTLGSYVCSCSEPGLQLSTDAHTCQDINECDAGNFGCSHICVNTRGSAYCYCPPGLYFSHDQKTCIGNQEPEANTDASEIPVTPATLRCADGYEMKDGTGTCEDVDECNIRNFGCEQLCVNTAGSAFCTCHHGFELGSDSKTCVDIDECANRAFGCSHNCVNTRGSAHCTCRSGFRLGYNKKRCVDINECAEGILKCDHKCVNTWGSAYCTCRPGLTLAPDKRVCIDVDECALNRHNCDQVCMNTEGSYKCLCHPGYVILSNNKCEGCRKNSYRPQQSTMCVECPPNSHTLGPGKTSLADCSCNTGYVGNPSLGIPCVDIDECDQENYGCSHQCVNSPGSAHCACEDGYQLNEGGKTCEDINECALNEGGCKDRCINSPGSFECQCNDGFHQPPTNPYSCVDINECNVNNGGCSQICVNFDGGRYCTCREGYRLGADQKSCSVTSCPELYKPNDSKLQCNSTKVNNKEAASPGTVCRLKCNTGFESEGPTEMICGDDGQWKGLGGVCIAKKCPPLRIPENGEVLPASCGVTGAAVGQRCFFTCLPGFHLVGRSFTECKKTLQWKHPNPTSCLKSILDPYIQCPSDITAELPINQSTVKLHLESPVSNMESDFIKVSPYWVRNLEGDFPAGLTEVTFTATHPMANKNISCTSTVTVLDKDPPLVTGCPESLSVSSYSLDGVNVTWDEPIFDDNGGVASIWKSQEPGSIFNLGNHMVHYEARDRAGNLAECSFSVNVTRKECSEPEGMLNGERNCGEWPFGTLCQPECNPGHMFYGNASDMYMAGFDCIWTPSDVIPDCSPFYPEGEGDCRPGFEATTEADTGERICVACPPGMHRPPEQEGCLPCPELTYQDEFGQSSCHPCSDKPYEKACTASNSNT